MKLNRGLGQTARTDLVSVRAVFLRHFLQINAQIFKKFSTYLQKILGILLFIWYNKL